MGTINIYEQVPFPEVVKNPSALALLLQKRIKYMFNIIVEPIIIRHSGSYYKTREFRYAWSMQTPCGRYEIACIEPAKYMGKRSAWYVLDQMSLANYMGKGRTIGKVIY